MAVIDYPETRNPPTDPEDAPVRIAEELRMSQAQTLNSPRVKYSRLSRVMFKTVI